MDDSRFDMEMTALVAFFGAGDVDAVLDQARVMRLELLADSPLPSRQLGWVLFYEFRALREAARWDDAVAIVRSLVLRANGGGAGHPVEAHECVLERDGRVCATLPKVNVAWLLTMGAECAVRIERADLIQQFGESCLELRRRIGDPGESLNSAMTFCVLLRHLDRPDLNGPFCRYLIEQGRALQAAQAVLDGYSEAVAHLECEPDPLLARLVTAHYHELRSLDPAQVGIRAPLALIERIEGAGWRRE